MRPQQPWPGRPTTTYGAWREQRPGHPQRAGLTLNLGLHQVHKPTQTIMDGMLNRQSSFPSGSGCAGEKESVPLRSNVSPPAVPGLPCSAPSCLPRPSPRPVLPGQALGVLASWQFWLNLGFWAAPGVSETWR